MNDWLAGARTSKGRLCEVLDGLGLRWVDLDDAALGVGVALEWAADGGDPRLVVASVMAGDNDHTLLLTSGVVADAGQDRLAILEFCNRCVGDNPGFPVFLHDADAGWDVLLQTNLPVQLMVDVPLFFKSMLQQMPMQAEQIRGALRERTGVGGRAYRWEDLDRLVQRSMA